MNKKVEIEVSARHIHLSKEDFELLFGTGADYKNIYELSQSGEFATDKKVEILGKEETLEARFLGPFRERSQVELSLTDAIHLDVKGNYAISADDDSGMIKIKGPAGEIERKALIITKRHLHANPSEAKELGVEEGQNITVKTMTDRGEITFADVEVKIKDSFNLRVHLDTDEGNAAGINEKNFGEILL